MNALEHLHFGFDDAERDDANGLLRASFIRTAAFQAAVSGQKMLVIGRKGSGKSAICMRLAAGPDEAVLITPDDAVGGEIRRFELQGLTGDTARTLAWRYIFAVQAAQHLVARAGRPSKAVKALKRFLRANGESPRGGLGATVRGLQKTSLSLEAFGIKAGVEMDRASSEGARANHQLEIVERGVAEAFASLASPGGPLLLLVDQLEQVWSSEADAHSMIIGLLLAAKYVTARYGPAVRCLVFLRADIYDSLSFSDGDKFRGDELRLGWSEESLLELALSRARASAGPELSRDRLWTSLFPERAGGEPTTAYVLRRALHRPRDVIQFLNLARDVGVQSGHDRVHEGDLLLATRQFSEWKLKDLAQEYLVAYPYLGRLFPLFQNLGYIVMRNALAGRLEQTTATLHADFPAYVRSLTLPGVLATLYAVGFLGVRRGNDVVYAGGPDLTIQPYETEFHIHPCFRAALGATSSLDMHAYTPLVIASIQAGVGEGLVYSSTGGPRAAPLGRDHRLLNDLTRSCESILRFLGRAVDLPADARMEIATQVSRIMADTRRGSVALTDSRRIDAADHVIAAATYLEALAAQLRAGAANGLAGAEAVSAEIMDEARRLIAAVGGASGSSGASR